MNLGRALLFTLCFAGAAVGQTSTPQVGVTLDPETRLGVERYNRQGPLGFAIYSQGSYDFDADIDNSGEVAVSRFGAGAGMEWQAAEKLIFRLAFDAEWSDYDFSGPVALIGADPSPWEDLQSYRVAPSAQIGIDEQWTVLVGGDIRIAYEPGADIGDSITGGGFAGARYQWTDKFALTFGASVQGQLEDDTVVVPLIGVEWEITERLRLDSRGIGLRLGYKLTEQFDIALRGSYDPRSYRLSEDRALNPNGVVNDDRVVVGAELTWRPAPFAVVTLFAGANVWQEFEILNSTGGKITDNETDPAPFIAARATIRF